MPRIVNPKRIVPPASRHSHGIVHSARAYRLVISGQVGVTPDGLMAEGLEAQMVTAWQNIVEILHEAGMTVSDLVRVNVMVTVPGSARVHRLVLERVLGRHAPTIGYMEVAALAQAEFLVAIDGEAVSEETENLFDEVPQSSAMRSRYGRGD